MASASNRGSGIGAGKVGPPESLGVAPGDLREFEPRRSLSESSDLGAFATGSFSASCIGASWSPHAAYAKLEVEVRRAFGLHHDLQLRPYWKAEGLLEVYP